MPTRVLLYYLFLPMFCLPRIFKIIIDVPPNPPPPGTYSGQFSYKVKPKVSKYFLENISGFLYAS